ncbi:MAG TPA: 5-formyltetrahydrofolate cyclo-ligase, partial [Rhodopila sp.]|nr:5-formyltetrahydrofolate cyclo-ligase [Rhodopila sp.]
VPVVGFDKRGYRLGYGGGYYDRTLAAQTMRPRTLAIGFAISEIPTIHPQPHDIPMDVVVTERGIRVMRTAPAAE